MDFRESNLRGEVMAQALLLQQGIREHNLHYECMVNESDAYLTIEFRRKGEKIASFHRSFTLDMANIWFESVITQLGREHLLLIAEVEFLDLAVKRCRKLMHKGVVDKSAYLNVRSLADQVFDSYDMSPDNRMSNNNVLNAHEIIAARKAADTVATLICEDVYQ